MPMHSARRTWSKRSPKATPKASRTTSTNTPLIRGSGTALRAEGLRPFTPLHRRFGFDTVRSALNKSRVWLLFGTSLALGVSSLSSDAPPNERQTPHKTSAERTALHSERRCNGGEGGLPPRRGAAFQSG